MARENAGLVRSASSRTTSRPDSTKSTPPSRARSIGGVPARLTTKLKTIRRVTHRGAFTVGGRHRSNADAGTDKSPTKPASRDLGTHEGVRHHVAQYRGHHGQ